ncbi:N-acetylmuramoyl-L-alanine amidase AmiC precursor [bacterium BMS3Abin05]|nr:N-acetylmuramoyl-L-alanine amidase AmiC precursor [bacterium BMS3Abin05]GBE28924.1 N-acetylmuramoyl-L-alanine amidase AmiC precursor [bacterium BMS3Bbin03]HDK35939.1 N-acetylmuramoyl-L-alanine amidase [Bacteroidota bacterium]
MNRMFKKIIRINFQKSIIVLGIGLFLIRALPLFSFQDATLKINVEGEKNVTTNLDCRVEGKLYFVLVRKLADVLEARTYYNNLAKKMVLYMGAHKIKVTALNPFVVIDNRVYQMPVATLYDRSGIWVPVQSFMKLLHNYYSQEFQFDPRSLQLSIFQETHNIARIRVEKKVNGTLIRIMILKKFNSSNIATRVSQKWLYVDIYGGTVDTTRLRTSPRIGIVRRIIPIQFEESAQLSFQLMKAIDKKDVSLQIGDGEILVSIRTSKKIPKNILLDLENEKQKWKIDKIIIDPGHGGKDPGAIGPTGLKEKDVVLDIGRRLRDLLRKKLHVKVLMTRSTDRFVELRERSAFANRNGGKLFISIHANSNPRRSVRGFTTYCLGPARSDEDRAIAQEENSVIKYEDSWAGYGDLTNENFILLSIAQNSFNKESQNLAAMIQKVVHQRLHTYDFGVRQAGYLVLVGTTMPKILVEAGFISNRKEERLLRSARYRQKIAEVIFAGIKKFRSKEEKIIETDNSMSQVLKAGK